MSVSTTRSTVLLVRHAHTDMAGRFCGRSDLDLSQMGQQQLQEIVQRIGKWPFARVYSSSLMRARRTAETVAASKCLELNVRAGLDEINFGAWEGKSWAEIEALYPVDAARWLKNHPAGTATGGELFLDFQQRVLNEFRYLAKEAQNTCIAIVTHAGFIRTALVSVAALDAADAWTLPLEYGSITELNYLQEGWHVNDIASRIECHPRFA
jgi:alpha-ribazole phosphatase